MMALANGEAILFMLIIWWASHGRWGLRCIQAEFKPSSARAPEFFVQVSMMHIF